MSMTMLSNLTTHTLEQQQPSFLHCDALQDLIGREGHLKKLRYFTTCLSRDVKYLKVKYEYDYLTLRSLCESK